MTVYINTTGCTNDKGTRSNITLTRVLVLSAGLKLEVGEGLHFMALTLQVLFSEGGLLEALSLRVASLLGRFVYARLISQSRGAIPYRAWC